MYRRIVIGAIVAATALGLPGIVRLARGGDDAVAPAAAAQPSGRLPAGEIVEFWRERSVERPADFISRTELGTSYVGYARETGDVTAYVKAEQALSGALEVRPDYLPARIGLAGVRFSNHDFVNALADADAILAEIPGVPAALAVKGDAELELGRLTDANRTYDQLYAAEPSAPVLSRLARLAFVQGRGADAIVQATNALDAAVGLELSPAGFAWYRLQLADLQLKTGDVRGADEQTSLAASEAPSMPSALAARGRALAAAGRLHDATKWYERATAIVPEPVWLLELAQIDLALGDQSAADRHLATLESIAELQATAIYNRPLVFFHAEHGDPDRAVQLAQAELAVRHDAYSYDALVWALHAAGRDEAAVDLVDDVFASGIEDPLLLYRAGVVSAGAARDAAATRFLARALEINPHFDPIGSPTAAALLEELS